MFASLNQKMISILFFFVLVCFGLFLSLSQTPKKNIIETSSNTKPAEYFKQSKNYPKKANAKQKKVISSVAASNSSVTASNNSVAASNSPLTQEFQSYRKAEYEKSVRTKLRKEKRYAKYQKQQIYKRTGGSLNSINAVKAKMNKQHQLQFEHQISLGSKNQKRMIVQKNVLKKQKYVQTIDARRKYQALNSKYKKGN